MTCHIKECFKNVGKGMEEDFSFKKYSNYFCFMLNSFSIITTSQGFPHICANSVTDLSHFLIHSCSHSNLFTFQLTSTNSGFLILPEAGKLLCFLLHSHMCSKMLIYKQRYSLLVLQMPVAWLSCFSQPIIKQSQCHAS